MNTILLALGALLGVILFARGLVWMISARRCKELKYVPFRSGLLEVEIVTPGIIGVEIVGGYHVDREPAIPVSVSFDGGGPVPLRMPLIPFKLNRRGNRAVEVMQFQAVHAGTYRLHIAEVSKVRVFRSMLSTQRAFANPVPVNELSICIVESIAWSQRFFAIILVVFGANMVGLCIVMLILNSPQ
jgi:hypothetical protein